MCAHVNLSVFLCLHHGVTGVCVSPFLGVSVSHRVPAYVPAPLALLLQKDDSRGLWTSALVSSLPPLQAGAGPHPPCEYVVPTVGREEKD